MIQTCVECSHKGQIKVVCDDDNMQKAFEFQFNKRFAVQKDAALEFEEPLIPIEDVVKEE